MKVLIFIASLFIASPCWADVDLPFDTVWLTNGYSVKGKTRKHPVKNILIVEFANGGRQFFHMSNVKKIEKNSSETDQFGKT